MMNTNNKYKNKNTLNTVELNQISINKIIEDKRKLLLFKNPIILKRLEDESKNNINLVKYKKMFKLNTISFKLLVKLFMGPIKFYNDFFNKYLKTYNQIDLILQVKKDENYKLKREIANYFYIINRIFPVFERKSMFSKPVLFTPKDFFRIQPYFRFKHRYNKVVKFYLLDSIFSSKTQIAKHNKEVINLFYIGKNILIEIDNQIMKTKKLINLFKNKDIILKTMNSLPVKKKDNVDNKDSKILNINSNLNTNNDNFSNNTNYTNYTNLDNNTNFTNNNNNTNYTNINNLDDNFDNVNSNRKLLLNKVNKLLVTKNLNSFNLNLNKNNEIKMEQTMKAIFKNKDFNSKFEAESINYNPVELLYFNDNIIYYNNNNKKIRNIWINNSSSLSASSSFRQDGNLQLQNKPIIHQYLKSMSIFNKKQKGILFSYSNLIGFNFNKNKNKLIMDIYKLLASSFKAMYCLISKPVFVMTPDKIIIQLFYFLFIPNILKFKKIFKYGNSNRHKNNKKIWFKRKKLLKKNYRKFRKIKLNVRIKLRNLSNVVITKIFKLKFKLLCDILSRLFKKPVQLDLIRIHYPYNDSNILVNLLGIMINKIKLRIIFRKLFEKAVIKSIDKVDGKNIHGFNFLPAFLSGLNIRVAGRLLTHRVIPRKTVKAIRRGSTSPGKINFSDVARYTNKNKRGAFSITVSSGQNFFN